MYTNEQIEPSGRRRRRMHSPEFKAELVSHCQQAGVSVAAIAMEHGINPNLLRRWITEHERLGQHEALPNAPIQRDIAAQLFRCSSRSNKNQCLKHRPVGKLLTIYSATV